MQFSKTESDRNRNISVAITLAVSGVIVLALIVFKIGSSVFKTQESSMKMALEAGNYSFENETNTTQKQTPLSSNTSKTQNSSSSSYIKGNDVSVQQSDVPNVVKNYRNASNHQTTNTEADKNEFVPGITPSRTEGNETKTGIPIGEGREVNLANRKVILSPQKANDTKEEGKVVVEIMVDKSGNVVEANPNGRGTTTSSAILKAKAKQIAIATKFNEVERPEIQKGTISINFTFN